MIDNAIFIEAGQFRDEADHDRVAERAQQLVGGMMRLKDAGKIADFEAWTMVTGNKQERASFVLLKGSADQINQLVSDTEFQDLQSAAWRLQSNYTVSRVITAGRMLELNAALGRAAP